METKVFKLAIKEMDEAEGKFRGYLSVFNNVDHGGDLVEKGAFSKTLQENKAFPLLWAHSAQEPGLIVGSFHGAEDRHGLLIDGEFFRHLDGGKKAYDTVKTLYDKKIKVGLSIGYKAVQWANDKMDEQEIRRLKEIQLFEGSLTLFPMNDQALVQSMKDMELKPYPNEHACRVNDPGKYEEFRRGTRKHEGKEYSIIYGKPKDGEGWEEQAYRYGKDTWTAAEAKAHCKSHEGSFEAASGGKTIKVICTSCGETAMEIFEPVTEKAEAFETKEPAKDAIPEPEPPKEELLAENAAFQALEQMVRGLNKI